MRHRFLTCDVFTDRIFGGNPLAVFPDAGAIPAAAMQRVARELNLSETTFVLPPDDAANTRRVRIFTPTAEVPFAGHPTVGTAFVLAATGAVALDGAETVIVFEEGVGPVPVIIRADGGKPVSSTLSVAQLPERGPAPPAAAGIAAALSLDLGDLDGGAHAPAGWSCGLPFLFIALRDTAAVARARVDAAAWQRAVDAYWAKAVFLFAYEEAGTGVDIHARMFAPAYGVAEDPATGSAVAALAGYLVEHDERADGTHRWTVAQGVEMGRPSRLALEADIAGGRIAAVRVGGASVLVGEGEMEIPG